MSIKTKKERIPRGVRLEFEDVDYWSKLKKSKETYTLKDGTVLSAYEFMKKFMRESYGNGFSVKKPVSNILQTTEQKKWAYRNNNNLKRDALLVATKSFKSTNSDFLIEMGENKVYEDWEDTMKVDSYDEALDALFKTSISELGYLDDHSTRRGLLTFYFRLKKYLSYIRKDNKNGTI